MELYCKHQDRKDNLTRFLGKNDVSCSFTDLYYIPKNLIQRFCILANKLYDYKIFLELAVPNIFGILLEKKYQLITFFALWNEDRENIIEFIKQERQIMSFHSFKLSNDSYRIEIKKYIDFHTLNDITKY